MGINELEHLMIANGIVLRAIPEKIVDIYEKEHIKDFSNGIIRYVDSYKREMLVVERIPVHAGTFITEIPVKHSPLALLASYWAGNRLFRICERLEIRL